MSSSRPAPTDEAKKMIEEYGERTRSVLHNIAEKRALDEGRKEINENDITYAKGVFRLSRSSNRRKWSVRILIASAFALPGIQISAIYQLYNSIDLKNMNLLTQIGIVFPVFLYVVLILIISYVFREDLS
jgi:short-subunit dehydrogenase